MDVEATEGTDEEPVARGLADMRRSSVSDSASSICMDVEAGDWKGGFGVTRVMVG